MKLWQTAVFVSSVSLMTFLGYVYGRRDACREEAIASLTINTSTATAMRLGQDDDAIRFAETAISIAADGLERYNQPLGAIRVFFNGEPSPGQSYQTQRIKNASEYIDRYSASNVTAAAASYIRTHAHDNNAVLRPTTD